MAVIAQSINDQRAIYNADCMEVLPSLRSDSIGVSIYSPPFPETYAYSNDPRDMSNCATYEEGIAQYQFIVNEIFRLTRRGRLTCVHCMDLKRGSFFQRDFPGDIIRAHEKAGFNFVCRVTIWKDPWLVARRTRMKSLRHKNICEDSSTVRIGPADYVLVFKKGWQTDVKIKHPLGLKTYAGAREIPPELVQQFKNYEGDQRKNFLSHWIWRAYASPVWMDIRTGRLMPFNESKESDEEQHVCPLQLDVIERLLTLYSNEGDTLLTPFAGVGSEPYMALRMGRPAVGIELKPSYYRQMLKNLKKVNEPEVIAEEPMLPGFDEFDAWDVNWEDDESEVEAP
jgi:DNA modification methylase